MGRTRLYANRAEQQRAYRHRQSAPSVEAPMPTTQGLKRPPSRPARLAKLIDGITALHDEYEQWLDALPPSLTDSHLAEKLAEAVEQLETAADLIAAVDLPKGFGRD